MSNMVFSKMNQSIRMCLASSFAISSGLIFIGMIEQLDTPLSKTTCFTGYTDCGNDLRQHVYPFIPYLLGGIITIITMYVLLHYNGIFNKMEIDR
jgi:hypothetical protein